MKISLYALALIASSSAVTGAPALRLGRKGKANENCVPDGEPCLDSSVCCSGNGCIADFLGENQWCPGSDETNKSAADEPAVELTGKPKGNTVNACAAQGVACGGDGTCCAGLYCPQISCFVDPCIPTCTPLAETAIV